jgi:hypothetical protein
MLLVRKPQGAAWTPVMGAEVLFAPIDRSMLMRARRAARNVSAAEADDDGTSAIDMLEEMGDAMSRALITEGAQDWRGVCLMADEGDEGTGEPLPFSADNLAMALADPVTFEAFDAAYVVPFVTAEREREEPGNAFAASQPGTGGAATQGSDTASKPAPRKRGGAATSARTLSKNRRPRPKKASGAS